MTPARYTSEEDLLRLLYEALVDIRVDALESKAKVAFHLADLLHTLPLMLAKVASHEMTTEEVLRELRSRAHDKKLEGWLEDVLQRARGHEPVHTAPRRAS